MSGDRHRNERIFAKFRVARINDRSFMKQRSPLLRYGVAALAVALALLLKLFLEPVIVQETPFLLVFSAM